MCDVPYDRPLSEANDDETVMPIDVDIESPETPVASVDFDTLLYVHLPEPEIEISAEAAETPIATRAVEARRILRILSLLRVN